MFELSRIPLWFALLAGLLIPARAGGREREGTPQLDFPPSLGTLSYVERRTYDRPEIGYSVRYEGVKGLKADIYVYDFGMRNLGTGETGIVVRDHLEAVVHDVFTMQKRGAYRGVRLVNQEETPWATARGELPLQHALLEYSQVRTEGGEEVVKPVVSHVLLTTYQDHFFKIRFTYAATERVQGAAALRTFLQDCGELLR